MQGNWTLCVPLKYLIADIQEAKSLEFTIKILHPPSASHIEGPRGGGRAKKIFISYALGFGQNRASNSTIFNKVIIKKIITSLKDSCHV